VSRPRLVLLGVASAVAAACASTRLEVEGWRSPMPQPATLPALRAGFGRADITPPPGVGLAGNGPEGAESQGYRLRLYARVLVLEDSGGNRLALVVADLPLSSALLHRRVAEKTRTAGIGVDRLVIAVTHTHAGPGHFFEAAAYNEQGSSVVGFEPVMLDSLAARIARAVFAAVADLQPARVAWGSRAVWGETRIRSLPAMLRNIPPPTAPADAPTGLTPEYRLIDPELAMLRVDLRDPVSGTFRPAGAFSIFAMHGTGNASSNDLLDADIQGIVERRLERHIDRDLNHLSDSGFVPRAAFLFANGAEGDVSPAWRPESRCDVPVLTTLAELDGPFTRMVWQWRPPTAAQLATCRHAGREGVTRVGASVGQNAIALFDSLGSVLTDRLELGRAFATLPLRDSAAALGICPDPAVGMATLVGAPDAYTRMKGWRVLGVFDAGFAEGSPDRAGRGCQAQKKLLGGVLFGKWLNRSLLTTSLPSYAQVTVLRIGNRVIGALPAEVTTTAGRRMRDSLFAAARASGLPVTSALILGHANGYVEYVTTPEEYAAQYYEGGSTLYGPAEAAMFGRALARLARSISSGDTLAAVTAPPLKLVVGHEREIVKHQSRKVAPPPRIERVWCSGDTLFARFQLGRAWDWPVTNGDVAAAPRVEVVTSDTPRRVVTWDDDPDVEVRLTSRRHDLAWWEVRWSGAAAAEYRVRVGEKSESSAVKCGGGGR
jgi:neutral ceramidase